MTVKMEKTEYNETLEFFVALCAFPVVSSTFEHLSATEKQELNARIKVLIVYMTQLMPRLQEREANKNVRANSNT